MATPSSVEEYLAGIPAAQRAALEELRATVRAAAPDTVETISYQMPTFKYRGRALVGFAAFARHCSLFPYSTGVVATLQDDLGAYDTSGRGGTIRFTVDAPLPADLVRRIVATRIAEIDERLAADGRRPG
jgi:uncharacterized protein YdhG (YjbR/CyaY superfamily)